MKRSVPETLGQIGHCGVDRAIRIVFDLVPDPLNKSAGHATSGRRLQEMPRHDRVYRVVAFVADGHRQLHGVYCQSMRSAS
jgi:hypothetical protein